MTGELIPVTVYLPARYLGALKSLGRRHDVEPRDLIVELVRRAVTPPTVPAAAQAPEPSSGEPTKRTWRPWTEQDQARMLELNGQGVSDSAIARELGRNQAMVSAKRRAAGLPGLPPPKTRGRA